MLSEGFCVCRSSADTGSGAGRERGRAEGSGWPRRRGRARHRGSPGHRSRAGHRDSSGHRSRDGHRSPGHRSRSRHRSPGLRSPGHRRRSRHRSPGRRSPGHRSRSRHRSPGRKSPGRRSPGHSPQRSAGRVKQERDDRCGSGNEERQPSEQEHRRDRSGDRARSRDQNRHKDHSDRKKKRSDSPGARCHQRDTRNLREQQAERELYNERRRQHRQGTEGSGQNAEPWQSESKPKLKPDANKKPSFEPSGALLEDTNTVGGVLVRYSEPPEARIPRTRWRLYPFKKDELLPVLHIHRQSAYLLGRHRRIADIPIAHPSCSQQHAVLQYRLVQRQLRPYIMDLGSGNGTFLNNQRVQPQRYYELREKDVLRFGFSSREYVLLHESSDKSEANAKDEDEGEEEEEEGIGEGQRRETPCN